MIRDPDIARILQQPLEPEQRTKALVDTANTHGGRDNITVLLVQVAAGAERRGLVARLLGK
jgi:protein phosphatase